MKKAKADGALIYALETRFRQNAAVGTEWGGELTDAGVVVEVRIKVRREVLDDELVLYREEAITRLRESPWRVKQCEYERKNMRNCSNPIVAAVLSKRSISSFSCKFVCSRHRENHGVDPAKVLAVVELPGFELVTLRRQYRESQEAAREEG